jgi:hypothetical protein
MKGRKKVRGMNDLLKSFSSILTKPQLTRRYIKGLLRGEVSMFDQLKVSDKGTAILYNRKEHKFYEFNLETGKEKEVKGFN